MKRHLLRHIVQFGASMALCAAVLTGTAPGEIAAQDENYDKINITGEGLAGDNVPTQPLGIDPQEDRPPIINIPNLEIRF